MIPVHSTAANSRVAATNADLTAGTPAASADVASVPLLPEPTPQLGDVGAVIATLLIDSAFAQRKTAREAKVKAESAMEGAQKQELAEMRAAAEEKHTAAQIEAWTQIGTGCVTIGGMGLSAVGNGKFAKVGSAITEAMKNGGTDLAKGAGKLASSSQELAADTSKQSATEAEHAASRMKAAVEDCADDVRATKESVRKALEFLKEYQTALAQTQTAALHRA